MGQHDRQKHPLPRERWKYLKSLRPGRGRYIHVSAEVRMVPFQNPLGGVEFQPWIETPGKTYDVGRNKAKRLKRAA